VFASFASIGDVNLAEPNALIGFAGARVQAGTIAQELPPGFQRSEFLFEHGFIDRVVPRAELKAAISELLGYLVPLPLAAGADAAVVAESEPRSFGPLNDLFAAFVERVGLDADSSSNGSSAAGPAAAGATGTTTAARTTATARNGTAPNDGRPAMPRSPRGSGRAAAGTATGTSTGTSTGTAADVAESAPAPVPTPQPTRPRNG
jgi:hypothetical protein